MRREPGRSARRLGRGRPPGSAPRPRCWSGGRGRGRRLAAIPRNRAGPRCRSGFARSVISFTGHTGIHGWTGHDLLAPCGNLVPATKLELSWRGVGVDEDRALLAAQLVDTHQRPAHALLAGAGAPAIRVLGSIGPGLIPDGAAELLQR